MANFKYLDNKSANSTTNTLLTSSAVVLLGAYTTFLITNKNVQEHRYNAYKIYNEETPYPFNRRHEKIIDKKIILRLGWGNFGYGIVANF